MAETNVTGMASFHPGINYSINLNSAFNQKLINDVINAIDDLMTELTD